MNAHRDRRSAADVGPVKPGGNKTLELHVVAQRGVAALASNWAVCKASDFRRSCRDGVSRSLSKGLSVSFVWSRKRGALPYSLPTGRKRARFLACRRGRGGVVCQLARSTLCRWQNRRTGPSREWRRLDMLGYCSFHVSEPIT